MSVIRNSAHIAPVFIVWFSEQDNRRTESLHSYYNNLYSDWSVRIFIVIAFYFRQTDYLSTKCVYVKFVGYTQSASLECL
jgi:hypothetical protein